MGFWFDFLTIPYVWLLRKTDKKELKYNIRCFLLVCLVSNIMNFHKLCLILFFLSFLFCFWVLGGGGVHFIVYVIFQPLPSSKLTIRGETVVIY